MKEKEIDRLNKLKEYELSLNKLGVNNICGIDEAGRGPLAGPVVVASVIMPTNSFIEGVNDSKKISEKKREKIYEQIMGEALAYEVAIIDHIEVDELNVLNATKKGLTESIKGLKLKPDRILVDALENIDTVGIPYTPIVKGDANIYSIACASIIAKNVRDNIMKEWDAIYPEYGFKNHKGYGTAKHIETIKQIGICPIHRKTFVKKFI